MKKEKRGRLGYKGSTTDDYDFTGTRLRLVLGRSWMRARRTTGLAIGLVGRRLHGGVASSGFSFGGHLLSLESMP